MAPFLEHLHPKLVHFPIALFVAAFGFDLLSIPFKKDSWHRTARHLYIAATGMTPLVVLSGFLELTRIQLNHPVLEAHEHYALLTMGISLASLVVLGIVQKRFSKYFRTVFLIFCLVIVGFVALTANKGGTLVYKYGVGVAR